MQTYTTDDDASIYVLLIYPVDDCETYCYLFRSRESAVGYVKNIIDESWCEQDGDDAARSATLREIEESLGKHGLWKNDCTTYTLKEQKITA